MLELGIVKREGGGGICSLNSYLICHDNAQVSDQLKNISHLTTLHYRLQSHVNGIGGGGGGGLENWVIKIFLQQVPIILIEMIINESKLERKRERKEEKERERKIPLD